MIITLFLFSSCRGGGGRIPEKEDQQFVKAQQLYRDGRYHESMLEFQKLIEKREEAPQAHFEVGRLYLEHLNDPIAAIYHFRKFLELKPDVEQSPMVRQMIERSKKAFVQTLPGRPFEDQLDRIDVSEMLRESQSENLKLRKRLAALEGKLEKTLTTSNVESITFAPTNKDKLIVARSGSKHYTVVNGDTLSTISNKVYGSSAFWEKIYKANRDLLTTPHSLKIGQVLKIPPKGN